MENINDILQKSKLLFNYDPKKTLTENELKRSLDEVKIPISENAGAWLALDDLARRAGQAGETAVKTMGDDVLKHMPGGEIKMIQNGQSVIVKSGDDFLNNLKLGATLSKAEGTVLAKNLMKTNLPANSALRNTLTDKAADLVLKDARYANMSGDDIARALKRKGYNRDIAEEIGKKARLKGARGNQRGGGNQQGGGNQRGGGNQQGGGNQRRRGGGNQQGGGNQRRRGGGGQGGGNQRPNLGPQQNRWVRSVTDKHWKYISEMYRNGATKSYVRKWAIGVGIASIAFTILWNWLTGKDTMCGTNEYWDGSKCVPLPPPPPDDKCPSGTYWNGSKCVPLPPPPPRKKCINFPYTIGCSSPIIAEVQECLKITADGIFGNQTLKALTDGGYGTEITKEVYDKIKANCGKTNDNTTTTTTSDIINVVDPTTLTFDKGF